MTGVRDRLIHHYFGVNLDIVWQIAVDELPKVALQLEEILKRSYVKKATSNYRQALKDRGVALWIG